MPNECWNYMMITADKDELTAFLEEEFKNVPEDRLFIEKRGLEAVRLKLWTAWKPNFKWLDHVITKYRTCWIKNEWIVEDGEAGTWIGTAREGEKVIRQMTWDDMSLEESSYRFRVE